MITSVSVKKPLLQRRGPLGRWAFEAPNQGLGSSFCCWTAGQGLAPKECFFSQTPVSAVFHSHVVVVIIIIISFIMVCCYYH